MRIAALYTCFNRKEKTLSSLDGLYASLDFYNKDAKDSIDLTVYLTDDGCTDGTADAIRARFPNRDIHILQGDGNLYWAGGMRFAWKEALKHQNEWDFYLLLNDDTDIFDYCISELLKTHAYCLSKYGRKGIYSGITCAKDNVEKVTYGGEIFKNAFLGKSYRVSSIGIPQLVDVANANIMLVPSSVVRKIGIFYENYRHWVADYDYSMTARRKGIPVLVTANICGACDNDHIPSDQVKEKILRMTQKDRTAYFQNPLHSSRDYLIYIKRNMPLKYPFTLLFRYLHEYHPKVYYFINKR